MTAESVTQAAVGDQDRRRWVALAVIVVAQFMVVLDVAIVNVALPSIKTDLDFSQESLQWVITAYAIFFGGVLLLGGRLADLLGRRRLFMAGLALFTVSSLLDGLAWSEGSLIAFRVAPGSRRGAAVAGRALDPDHHLPGRPRAQRRARHLGRGLGQRRRRRRAARRRADQRPQLVVDLLHQRAGRRCSCSRLSPWLLRESRADLDHRHFDFAGAASITGGLMLLVYALTRATQHGWATAETIGLLAASAALIVAFFVIELRSKAPLLPLRIFRLRTLTASNVSGLLMGGAIFSQFFLLTLYMQQVLHYSALKTGVAYIALTLTIIVFSAVAQALVTRVGIRRVLPVGLALSTVGARALRAAAGRRPLLQRTCSRRS